MRLLENNPKTARGFPLEAVRFARLASGACVIAIIILSLVPFAQRPHTGMPKELEHFVAYAGAGLFLPLAWHAVYQRVAGWICLAAASGVLEIAQNLSPGRTPSFLDLAASVGGLTCGMACGIILASVAAAKVERSARL